MRNKERESVFRWKSVVLGLLVVSTIVVADTAFAAAAGGQSAGAIAGNLSGQGAAVGKALKIILEVIGFGMGGFGLVKLIGSFKSHEPKGMPIAMFVIGSLLVVLPIMISSTTQTVLQQDATGLSDIGAN